MPVGAFVEKNFSAHIEAKKRCLFGGLRTLFTQCMHVFRDKHAKVDPGKKTNFYGNFDIKLLCPMV